MTPYWSDQKDSSPYQYPPSLNLFLLDHVPYFSLDSIELQLVVQVQSGLVRVFKVVRASVTKLEKLVSGLSRVTGKNDEIYLLCAKADCHFFLTCVESLYR
jgi:hypothetical protein